MADSTAQILNVYVNSSNNLRVVIDGVHQRYRLYVCRPGACFGDPPHYQYYQIYAGGTWPKDLWVVTNVNSDTVYCAEIKSDDGTVRHDVVAYRTGSGSQPYYGSIIVRGRCPWSDGDLPPNIPNLLSPANGGATTNPNVTLQVQDMGDPDNYPRNYRDYYYRIEKTDGTWSQESGWILDTSWSVTVPSAGTYRWRAQSGDGELGSGWTGWWTFSYNVPPPPINQPPNVPNLVSPANGSTTTNPGANLCLQDTGDPDSYPRNYRDYYYRVEKTDGSWGQESGWTTNTCWGVTAPSAGTYRWRAQSGDGELGSGWTGWWTFSYSVPPPPGTTLNVRYVDQVYVQRTCEWHNGKCYWNHCGPSSVAMVLHYEGKEPRDVLYDRQATLDLVCQVKPNCSGGSNVGMMLNTLHSEGLQTDTDWSPTFNEIRQSIQNGHPVILFVWYGKHVAVGVGYEDNGTVVINDPYGGVSWWTTGMTKNLPPGSSPKMNGYEVEYSSTSGLNLTGAIFITGLAPVRQAATAVVGASGSTLTSEGVQMDFPPILDKAQLASVQPITVTYTPLVSPTYSISGFEAVVNSFRLSATDANSQTVQTLDTPYTFTLAIDLSIIDNWDVTGAQVAEDGTAEPLASSQKCNPVPVLARWDSGAQEWIVTPSVLDATADGRMIAHDNRFAEFAILVQRQCKIFLPVVIRQ